MPIRPDHRQLGSGRGKLRIPVVSGSRLAPDPGRLRIRIGATRHTASRSLLYLDGNDVLLDVVVGEPVPQLEPGGAQVTLVRVIFRVNRLHKTKKTSVLAMTIKNGVSDSIRSLDPDPGGQT
jgi:hypothetical protein